MIAVFIILTLAFVLISSTIYSKRKQEPKLLSFVLFLVIAILSAAVLNVLFYYWAFGAFRDPTPVVTDHFYLHQTGVVKEYVVKPRLKDWLAGANGDYEISIWRNSIPPVKQERIKLHPVLQVTTFANGKEIDSITLDKNFTVMLDSRYSPKTLITKLPKILWTLSNKIYVVKLEVIEGDPKSEQYANNFNMRIAVDEYP